MTKGPPVPPAGFGFVSDGRLFLQPLSDYAPDRAADDRRDPEQPQRLSASAPPKIAVAVERAGLSDAFDTGIATRWNSVSASPIAIGANPAGQFFVVTPMMTMRNSAVITTSMISTASSENCPAPP